MAKKPDVLQQALDTYFSQPSAMQGLARSRGTIGPPARPEMVGLAETIENSPFARLAGNVPDILRSWGWDQRLNPSQYALAAGLGASQVVPVPGIQAGVRALTKPVVQGMRRSAKAKPRAQRKQRGQEELDAKVAESAENAVKQMYRERVMQEMADDGIGVPSFGVVSPESRLSPWQQQRLAPNVIDETSRQAINQQLPDWARQTTEPTPLRKSSAK